ncbi:hypothetical protein CEXT_305921 [Caerostris extrusa]|uniref:Uncharacterized protein n=1 Tax=Caerostris extrusa TaxID=172846 RepID=A0AAV4VJY3_CAEEX|nr:hypothetical protein CEXT_305921 [Caerostris extrusa]
MILLLNSSEPSLFIRQTVSNDAIAVSRENTLEPNSTFEHLPTNKCIVFVGTHMDLERCSRDHSRLLLTKILKLIELRRCLSWNGVCGFVR